MSEMVPTGSKYSDQDRTQAAIQYAITGSLTKTSKTTDIPKGTLHAWKESEWWVEITEQVRTENASKHRAQYSKLVDEAQAQARKALPQATALQAMTIAGIATDKLYRADNLPSTLTGSVGSIQDLAREFIKLADENVVSVQHDSTPTIDDDK